MPTLTDEELQNEREAATRQFFDVSANEFVKNFEAGKYGPDDDGLMLVLMLFPELD